jgi:hypothetical protein
MFDGVPSSFITSNSDVVGLMNIVGYNDATPELRSGSGGTNLIASLALKPDTTALEALATTEALANAARAERLVTTATVASATPGDLNVAAGYMDMSVFAITNSTPPANSMRVVQNMFVGPGVYSICFGNAGFVNIDHGTPVMIDGSKSMTSANSLSDGPLTLRVITGTSASGPWILAGEQYLGPEARPAFITAEFVLPAQVSSRYFRIELDDSPSTLLTIQEFFFRRPSYSSSYRLLDNPLNPFGGGTASAFQVGSSIAYPNISEATFNLGGTRELTKLVAYASASPEMIPTRYSVWSGTSGKCPWTPINLSISPPFIHSWALAARWYCRTL